MDFFFLHIKVVVLSETPEMFLKIERVLNTFYTLFMRTLLQQGHTDGHFLFTNFPAFYFPSIQLKKITLKKNQPSVTRTRHPVKLTFYALFIKVAVWLCGILVADKDRFQNPPTSES